MSGGVRRGEGGGVGEGMDRRLGGKKVMQKCLANFAGQAFERVLLGSTAHEKRGDGVGGGGGGGGGGALHHLQHPTRQQAEK